MRNRILQTAHTKHFSHAGMNTNRDLYYHRERAKGGAGLLITGNRHVHPSSSVSAATFPRGYIREAVGFDRRMTAAVHEYGAAIIAQLNHAGVNGSADAPDDLRFLVSASAVTSPLFGEKARALEPDEIAEIARWWGRCAAYAREGGFDGVEVHLAHSYLLHQFLSPLYNKRTDEFGGSLENRLRFGRMVIDQVREQVGSDYLVGARISLADFVEGGLGVTDAIAVARFLESTDQVDYINVSGGGYHEGLARAFGTADIHDGWLVDMTAQVKRTLTRLPIFAVGGIRMPRDAEAILAAGQADMVAMTRALIADPELPNKLREGREDEIQHCIRANQGCMTRTWRGMPMACTVNPTSGREQVFGIGTLTRAKDPRQWLVIGGGPAGMKAAVTLQRRGHRVTLLEQADRLGGQINLAARLPERESLTWVVRDLAAQMERTGVDVRLGVQATPDLVRGMAPDGVLIATGARPTRSGFSSVAPLVDRVPGVDGHNVFTGWDVILTDRPEGRQQAHPSPGVVVVLDDEGNRYTAGIAELLLDRGNTVELVSRWNALFPATALTLDMPVLYERLFRKGLSYRVNSWVRAISERSVSIYNLYTGQEETLEDVSAVVLVTPAMSNDELYLQLKGTIPNLHCIGDCLVPRKLDHAIYEGYVAGREMFGEARYIQEDELLGP